MEFIIIFVIGILLIGIAGFIFDVNIKKLKAMTNIKDLDTIAEKYPDNIEMCKEYLKKLGNSTVNVQEDKESETTVYVAISDKIFIGNMKNSYARIQTIAHECLHTIQSRKILLFNFIFSNIYLIYFGITLILALIGILPSKMTFLTILCMLGLVYYSVKLYIENDAMIKARYLAKEYMEEKQISTQAEIDSLVRQYDKVNDLAIRTVQYKILLGILVKISILALVFFIR